MKITMVRHRWFRVITGPLAALAALGCQEKDEVLCVGRELYAPVNGTVSVQYSAPFGDWPKAPDRSLKPQAGYASQDAVSVGGCGEASGGWHWQFAGRWTYVPAESDLPITFVPNNRGCVTCRTDPNFGGWLQVCKIGECATTTRTAFALATGVVNNVESVTIERYDRAEARFVSTVFVETGTAGGVDGSEEGNTARIDIDVTWDPNALGDQ